MSLPQHTVEIGWETAVTGTLRFDVSKFDGPDVFANAFTNFFTGPLDDVTADVDGEAGATITRGRDALLGPIQAGRFDFTLGRLDDPSYYDPDNPGSPLAALDPGFVPLRPVRVKATVNGTTYPRFYGFIRSAKYNPTTRRVAIHAEDILLWLSRVKPSFAALASTVTPAVIGAILDACDWNDPNMRKLSAYGDPIASYAAADGSQFALALIVALIEAERGLFFADAAGRAVYEDRNARSRRTSPLASFATSELSVANDGSSGIDLDEILNEITVTGADSIPVTAKNVPSQRDFGIGELGDVSSDFIADQTLADAIANWEVALATQLRSPYVAGIDPFALERVYQIDLQDRVRILTPNLIPNPSFEVDTAGWFPGNAATITRRTDGGKAGSCRLEVTCPGLDAGAGINLATTAGLAYTISYWARSVTGRTLKHLATNAIPDFVLPGGNVWTRYTATFIATSTGLWQTYIGQSAGTFDIDAAQFEVGSRATMFNPADVDYHLERIVERFGFASGQFGVDLTLSKRGISGAVFDFSTFDGADRFVA